MLIRTGSPGRPPRLSHSSWTLPVTVWHLRYIRAFQVEEFPQKCTGERDLQVILSWRSLVANVLTLTPFCDFVAPTVIPLAALLCSESQTRCLAIRIDFRKDLAPSLLPLGTCYSHHADVYSRKWSALNCFLQRKWHFKEECIVGDRGMLSAFFFIITSLFPLFRQVRLLA